MQEEGSDAIGKHMIMHGRRLDSCTRYACTGSSSVKCRARQNLMVIAALHKINLQRGIESILNEYSLVLAVRY